MRSADGWSRSSSLAAIDVVATTRTPNKLNGLRLAGAEADPHGWPRPRQRHESGGVRPPGRHRASDDRPGVDAEPEEVRRRVRADQSAADRRNPLPRRGGAACPAHAGSSRKATPAGPTSVRADASRPRRIRWIPIRRSTMRKTLDAIQSTRAHRLEHGRSQRDGVALRQPLRPGHIHLGRWRHRRI